MMARLPLLHRHAAERGELGAARLHLEELAHRLRNNPSPEECERAAELFERMAADPRAHLATGLAPKGRPPESRWYDIGNEVEELTWQGQYTVPEARKRVARRHQMSGSRVKALHLEYLRAREEHRQACAD